MSSPSRRAPRHCSVTNNTNRLTVQRSRRALSLARLSGISGRSRTLGSTASLVFQAGSRRSPNRVYLFGGGGYVRTRTTGPNFGTLSNTSPAITGGAGVSFGSRSFALFVEGRYLNVYTDGLKPQLAPIVAGFSFGGL